MSVEWDRLTRTHFWPESIEFLRWLSKLLPPDAVLVNIGAYWESSTISILYDRPDIYAFSIDVEVCEVGLDNLAHFGMTDRVVRVLGKSKDVGRHWRWPVDMLYIDGDHSYTACRVDVDVWLPWLKSGGLVAFHDYGTEHTPGVRKVVHETMHNFQYLGKDIDEPKGVLVAYAKR